LFWGLFLVGVFGGEGVGGLGGLVGMVGVFFGGGVLEKKRSEIPIKRGQMEGKENAKRTSREKSRRRREP